MEEQRKPTRWGLWLVAGLVLLVGYTLSIGPASRLFDYFGLTEHDIAGKCVLAFYWPIVAISEHQIEPAYSWLEWYLLFWE